MSLPERFQFSQASLQDYQDCQRRFQLRYLENVAWPAVESEPLLESERLIRLGAHFHHLAHQYFAGVPAGRLSALAQETELAEWWRSFLAFVSEPPFTSAEKNSSKQRFPEITLSASFAGHRLVAKYDLLLVSSPQRLTIFDWKTTRKRPKRASLSARMQTRLYPYLAARAVTNLTGAASIAPEDVEMVYWFTSFPNDPIRFGYNQAQFQADEAFLTELIERISRKAAPNQQDAFPLTSDERRCRFCVYRSLCNRGLAAGDISQLEEAVESEPAFDYDLDFEQIVEIEF